MNEGRAGLEQVIQQYEQQRAEAMRIKQEAEIVLPFLRAAIEELDSNTAEATDAPAASSHRPLSTSRAKEEEAEARPERRSSAAVFGVADDEVEATDEDADADEAPPARRKSFGRTSIASLIDEAGKGKEKTG